MKSSIPAPMVFTASFKKQWLMRAPLFDRVVDPSARDTASGTIIFRSGRGPPGRRTSPKAWDIGARQTNIVSPLPISMFLGSSCASNHARKLGPPFLKATTLARMSYGGPLQAVAFEQGSRQHIQSPTRFAILSASSSRCP